MNILKLSIVAIAVLLSACQRAPLQDIQPSFTQEELQYIADHPVITYGLLEDHPPIVFSQDGLPAGVSMDYFRLIEQKTGFHFDLRMSSQVPELIEAIKACKVQALPGFRATPDRVQFMGFTDPFVSVGTSVILPNGTNVIAPSARIGAARGYAVLDLLNQDPHTIIPFLNNAAVVQGLIQKKVDAAVMTEPSAVYQLDHISGAKDFHTLNLPWTHYFSIGMCKDDTVLIQIFNKALRSVTKSEKKAIEDRWKITEVE